MTLYQPGCSAFRTVAEAACLPPRRAVRPKTN